MEITFEVTLTYEPPLADDKGRAPVPADIEYAVERAIKMMGLARPYRISVEER